jgi:hypothetical protein
MSLAINPDEVTHVIVKGDHVHGEVSSWREIDAASLEIDTYEFIDGDGQILASCGPGFRCRSGTVEIAGHLTSLLAVRFDG